MSIKLSSLYYVVQSAKRLGVQASSKIKEIMKITRAKIRKKRYKDYFKTCNKNNKIIRGIMAKNCHKYPSNKWSSL